MKLRNADLCLNEAICIVIYGFHPVQRDCPTSRRMPSVLENIYSQFMKYLRSVILPSIIQINARRQVSLVRITGCFFSIGNISGKEKGGKTKTGYKNVLLTLKKKKLKMCASKYRCARGKQPFGESLFCCIRRN